MQDNIPDTRNPEQERFWKRRLLAKKLASWRGQRRLIALIAVVLGAYLIFSLPWESWNIPPLLRHPSRILRAGAKPSRAAYLPFQTAELKGDRAMEEVKAIVAIGPRVAGTPAAKRTADLLADRLKTIGISPIVDEFTTVTPNGRIVFRNVMGMLDENAKTFIILASHYDTKSGISTNFVGANDSGSSSGLLLELARVMRAQPGPRPGILFAFLDGEECVDHYSDNDGLHGSRHLAAKLAGGGSSSNVLGVILLDMIGDRDLTITLPGNGTPELISMTLRSAAEEGVRQKFSLMDGRLLDDHVPFLKAGMPAVDIVDFCYGSATGLNDYWHTPQDTLDKLSDESLATVGRVTIRLANKLMEKAGK